MAIYFNHLLLQITIFLQILFPIVTCTESVTPSYNSNSFRPQCIETERQALLHFKGNLTDSFGRLSSWVGHNCCNWVGVGCSNHTGNVLELDLSAGFKQQDIFWGCTRRTLTGELSPSLLDLKHLNYLNLSCNNFNGSFPSSFGSLQKLKYLDLSHTMDLLQIVPLQLGNLTNLHYLDLSYSFASWSDLNWLRGLTSLEYLNLEYVNLSKASATFSRALSFLPSLSELHLKECSLEYPIYPLSFSIENFTSLSVIDLSWNMLISEIPPWLINVTTLVDLDLSWCNITAPVSHLPWYNLHNLKVLNLEENSISDNIGTFIDVLSKSSNITLRTLSLEDNHFIGELGESLGRLTNLTSLLLRRNLISGEIPSSIGMLSFLEELSLFGNLMNGSIPENFDRLSRLRTLDLSDNKMTGPIPISIGELSSLTELFLHGNYWTGTLSEVHFRKLSNLKSLWISSSNGALVFGMAPDWIPPFRLEIIQIDGCVLGPIFPPWIQTQTDLIVIALRNAQISETIPDWFWNLSTRLVNYLDLSGNEIGGVLPYSLEFNYSNSMIVDLSNNNLHGPVPLWSNLSSLILRNNSFSGPIPSKIGTIMSSLNELDLSSNCLNGTIPKSISIMENLRSLDLSNSKLSGKMLDKWDSLRNLEYLDLSKNRLLGEIPASICSSSGQSIRRLDLSDNRFHGVLPLSLPNCTELDVLNLEGNKLSGNIPRWKGKILDLMQLLNLRMNRFSGEIPEELCDFPLLHALDLSHNNLSGPIPACFGNLRSLIVSVEYDIVGLSNDAMDFGVKGIRYDFFKNQLIQLNIIDLSGNNLTGEIPEGISNLIFLDTLNFSQNHLRGNIPEKIGTLRRLETLDLSHNHLSGPIPENITSLTMLSHLDLSFNNLSGQIPTANQFSTFNSSIYEGNPRLCGDPLPNLCYTPGNEQSNKGKFKKGKGRNKYIDNVLWYGVSIGLGFVMGFWGILGSLVIKRSWRIAYFKFFHGVKDRVYVFIMVKIARLKQKSQRDGN